MTAFPRIKVTTKVARLYANLQLRNKTYDGNYIIWMTDLNSVPGATLAERVAYVGGAMLTPQEAKEERNGTAKSYARVYTPIYLDKNAEAEAVTEKAANDGVETPSNEEEEIPTVTTPGTPPPVYADDIITGGDVKEGTDEADSKDDSADSGADDSTDTADSGTDTAVETAAHEEESGTDSKKTK